ncbi:cysteine-rich RECEPTOR-like kinase [Rhynchospora pubera]|uniref:Cysteine-rich RECEPTOR-like kinase n=1 Tax=Rhynchospora pubera TaxID=906938 RepID=A0AAV8G1G6_9POAL|nr:cysteine-rich RECEPTOR-like kinase [Rhynchospora pubera]
MRKAGSVQPFQYRLSELEKATNNFSDRNKLGCGGSGVVYKSFDKNKTHNTTRMGGGTPGYFAPEICYFQLYSPKSDVYNFGLLIMEIIAGCTIPLYASRNSECLAYDMWHRWKNNNNSQPREWSTLDRIIKGIANGISYLHHGLEEKYLIHGNLNPSTIWLDDSWNAQLSSFSLTRVLDVNESFFKLSSPCGALGYTAPEIYSYLRITTKSDVYSYGITLLRILVDEESGCYFTDFNTIFKVWNKWQQNKILELLDQRIHSCHPKEALCFFQIALLCIQGDPDKRPNMQEVVKMLTSLDDLPVPTPPVFRVQHRH